MRLPIRAFFSSTNVPAFEPSSSTVPGPQVAERADERAGADLGVDRDDVRADLGAGGDLRRAAEHGERVHDGVRLELDGRLDPRRGGIDDPDAREHVRLVDAVAQGGGGRGELDARVDALGLGRVGRLVHRDALAVLDEVADRVGEVELALRVVRLEPLERRPEQLGAEDVDRGVHLADRELLGRRVDRLDDRAQAPVAVADDAPVAAHVGRREGEHRRGRVRGAVGCEEPFEQLAS